jgi:hypothetical protein
LRRRLRRSVAPVAIWIPIVVLAAVLQEISGVSSEVATLVPFALMAALPFIGAIYRHSAMARERGTNEREAYLSELRTAAPALTPAERERELETVAALSDEATAGEVRELFESLPGGTRRLPALKLRDPDAWFRIGRAFKLRALVLYPAVGLVLGAGVVGLESLGVGSVGPLGIVVLCVPGLLTWRDDALADVQPGERAAWSLSATLLFLVWLVAGLLAFAV